MASSSSSRSREGYDPCSICLEPAKQEEAYLDRCFHSFCYQCIAHWCSVVTDKHPQSLSSMKCPLCKAENSSIVHGINGEFFQRNYVSKDHGKSCLSSAHQIRLKRYNDKADIEFQQGSQICKFDVQQFWKSRRYLRKNIWFLSWLRREIQALIQEDDVDIIVHHIHGMVDSFLRRQREGIESRPEQKREEFRALLSDAASPFILGRTERFVDEVELFLASGLTVEAYDKVCMRFWAAPASGATRESDEDSCNLQDRFLDFLGDDLYRTD